MYVRVASMDWETNAWSKPRWIGGQNQFQPSRYFSSFSKSSSWKFFNITLTFDRCHHTLAVVTSVKYECDLRDLIGALNSLRPSDAYMRHYNITTLLQIMACRVNAGILLIGPLGTNFSEILVEIYTFSFRKMHWKMSSGKCRPFCLGLNVLNKFRNIHNEEINERSLNSSLTPPHPRCGWSDWCFLQARDCRTAALKITYYSSQGFVWVVLSITGCKRCYSLFVFATALRY